MRYTHEELFQSSWSLVEGDEQSNIYRRTQGKLGVEEDLRIPHAPDILGIGIGYRRYLAKDYPYNVDREEEEGDPNAFSIHITLKSLPTEVLPNRLSIYVGEHETCYEQTTYRHPSVRPYAEVYNGRRNFEPGEFERAREAARTLQVPDELIPERPDLGVDIQSIADQLILGYPRRG